MSLKNKCEILNKELVDRDKVIVKLMDKITEYERIIYDLSQFFIEHKIKNVK